MAAKLLIVGHQWPEPVSSAAGTRMLQLMQVFREAGFELHFCCAAEPTPRSQLDLPVARTARVLLNDASFDDYVRELQPDIVLYDRFVTEEQFGWRLSAACPSALRVLDSEDLHGWRRARELAVKRGDDICLEDEVNDVALRELSAIFRCDLSLIISEAEMTWLQNRHGVSPDILLYIPFLPGEKPQSNASFIHRQGYVHIGNFLHAPNRDAVEILRDTLWPAIRRRQPQASLYVFGPYASESVLRSHDPGNGFHMMGVAETAREVLQHARVLLAPLRFGAGMKGKLLDAMWAGTPSVTTAIGAEGMHADLPWPGFVGPVSEVEKMAEASVALHENATEWKEAVDRIDPIVRHVFDTEAHKKRLVKRVEEVSRTLSLHRSRNSTGMMLRMQAHRATEYMSRWIELKNARGSDQVR